MPNGKLGDHPLTDILVHKHEVYGQEADELIRKISQLSSWRELHEWWDREIGWSHARDAAWALSKARLEYQALVDRARNSGWETPEDPGVTPNDRWRGP